MVMRYGVWCFVCVYVKIVWHLLLNKDIIYVKSFSCEYVKIYNVTNAEWQSEK